MRKTVRFVRPDGTRYCQVSVEDTSVTIDNCYDGKFYKWSDMIHLVDKKDAKTVFGCVCRYFREGTVYELREEEVD